MKVFVQWWCALAFCAASGVSLAASDANDGWQPLKQGVVAALDVDADGHVVHAQAMDKNPLPQMQPLLEQTVAHWEFVPATVDGNPAPARTYARFTPQIRKDGANGQVGMRLRYDGHGPDIEYPSILPYPAEMIRAGAEANVVVDSTVDASGRVTDIRLVSAKTSNGVRATLFYEAIKKYLASAHVFPEMVAGHPVSTHSRIPYMFALAGDTFHRSPLLHAMSSPEVTSQTTNAVSDASASGVPIALDSPLKLAKLP